MPICPCASLDWRDVIDEATQKGEACPEHHPLCTAKRAAAAVTEATFFIGPAIDDLKEIEGINWTTKAADFGAMLEAMRHLDSNTAINLPPLRDVQITLTPSNDDGLEAARLMFEDFYSRFTNHYITINGVEIICRFVNETSEGATVKVEWEILDVLSPPEARAAWLEEKNKPC